MSVSFNHISPEKRDAIRQDRLSGMLLREVAAKHGVSERSVRRNVPGVQPGRSGRIPKLDYEQSAAALRAHEAGDSVTILASRYNVTERTMKRSLRKARADKVDESSEAEQLSVYIDGACSEELPELFEYDPEEWPNKSEEQWRQDLAYALDVCIECPVMTLCGEQATKGERFWTVRGGREPHRWLADHPPIGVLH